MQQLRITGLVRVADQIRRDLADPAASEHREQLLARVRHTVGAVDTILHKHGMKFVHLPGPSRRAYAFLHQLATTSATATATGTNGMAAPPCLPPAGPSPTPEARTHSACAPAPRRAESVGFNGLSSFLVDLLDDIAVAIGERRLKREAMLGIVQSTCGRLNECVDSGALQPAQLKPASRDLLAWFRWTSRPEPFAAYADAVERAQRVLGDVGARHLKWSLPLLVHFRPIGNRLYQWRPFRDATRLVMPTPMMAFDAEQFSLIGRWMCNDKSARRTVLDWVHGQPYVALAGEIQAMVGQVERTGGITHDLAVSFERVNRDYFAGQMARPRLIWSRSLTGRIFGTYRATTDTVCISGTLDQPHVPVFVLDHVMHHELLHKRHGREWRGRRQHVHTPAFRADERRFREFTQADAFLKTLAREHG